MTSPNSSSPHASRGGQVLVQQGIKKKSVLSVVLVERRWVVISAAALMLLGSTIASPPPPPPPSSGGSSAGGRPFAEPEKTSAELQLLPAIDHQQAKSLDSKMMGFQKALINIKNIK
jgi:hypothetical protein